MHNAHECNNWKKTINGNTVEIDTQRLQILNCLTLTKSSFYKLLFIKLNSEEIKLSQKIFEWALKDLNFRNKGIEQ